MISKLPAASVSSEEDRVKRRYAAVAVMATAALVSAPSAHAAELCGVAQTMVTAANYWVDNGPDQAANNWQNATYHVGNLAVVRTTGVSNHRTLPWAEANKYQLPGTTFDATEYTTGEAYEDLAFFHPEPEHLQPLRDRVHAQITAGELSTWDSPEAVNLAMPAWVRLAEPDVTEAAHTLFHNVSRLYDRHTGLWWHDRRFVGTPVYWSQANGEAIAGLVKVLVALPKDDPHRGEYTRIVRQMAAKLRSLQRADGSWGADLLHPWLFGSESGGTSLITYAFGAGVTSGILDASYQKPAMKAWNWLTTKALQPSGAVGYVQGPGSAPWDHFPIKAADTSAYGVGDFLLAGQQIAHLTPGCVISQG
ncbi:glycoside hydrolase family 88 protein [Kibdelosporangium lantanae]